MKNSLLLLFLLASLVAPAQKISGLYTGTLYNDSARMTQHYEIALSEYRGKITGYCYVTFVSKDTFYYGVRSVRGVVEDGQLIVAEDKMIANNFPQAPDKGVHRIFTIPLNGQDSVTALKGSWKTTRTKKFLSVPGTLDLGRTADSTGSRLIAHLRELDILPTAKQAPTVAARPEKERKDPLPVQPTSVARIPAERRGRNVLPMVEVLSDSVTLSLYDNGVIDGDSVTVYAGGQVLLSAVKLTATATKRVVMVPKGGEMEILLVAENLGTIPPNTGLLVIRDGDKMYSLNFSADLQTNAAVVLRRKIN
jgi:hypothetical protein